MTIVAAVKSRDCLVMGTDSVSTIMTTNPQGQPVVFKSYSHTQKLFHLRDYSIGVATWGAGAIGGRSIAGLVADFGATLERRPSTIQEAASLLDSFIATEYDAQFSSLPAIQQPVLGFWVGGYSDNATLSELWAVNFPSPPSGGRVSQTMTLDYFGAGWSGIQVPFWIRLQKSLGNPSIMLFHRQ